MPVIVREGSWRIKIFTDDHEPPHIHVYHGRARVRIRLPGPGSPTRPMHVPRMATREVLEAIRLVERHANQLVSAWKAIHGIPKPDR
jgi:Domain of unknown function (DUF4160)